jgi:hypothetical protein
MNISEKYQSKIKTTADVTKLLKGKKVRVISNGSGSGLKIDTITTILRGSSSVTQCITAAGGGWCFLHELEEVEVTVQDLKDSNLIIDEEIAKLAQQKLDTISKIKFMEENNIDIYDENIFKTLEILKTLDKKTTNIQKAVAIAKIVGK